MGNATRQLLPGSVIRDVQVWRAAMQVSPEDRRPTGAVQLQKAARIWQQHLDRHVAGNRSPALQEWGWLLNQLDPNLTKDPFAPMLADRLAAISRAGVNVRQLLRSAASSAGPLPDDHAAAALWWRISRHLTPPVAAQVDSQQTLTRTWTPWLAELVGKERSATLRSSPCWPPLVTAVDHALQRGWQLDDLLRTPVPGNESVDQSQALLCHISLLTDPAPDNEDPGEPLFGARRPTPGTTPSRCPRRPASAPRDDITTRPVSMTDAMFSGPADEDWVEPDLAVAALVRGVAGPPEQTDADVHRMFTRAMAYQISRDRIIEINKLALAYFRSHFPSSWGHCRVRQGLGLRSPRHRRKAG